MISVESRRVRRIIGSFDRGTDLLSALLGVCSQHKIRTGEFRAIGSLENAELSAYDQRQQKWTTPRVLSGGGLELLNLVGNISELEGSTSIVAQATLMRDRDAGAFFPGLEPPLEDESAVDMSLNMPAACTMGVAERALADTLRDLAGQSGLACLMTYQPSAGACGHRAAGGCVGS